MKHLGRAGACSTFIATMLLPFGAGWAQTGPAAEDAGSSPAIEEIVVTAQKRAENVQSVPIAITALSANALEARGITNTENLNFVTPGLNINRQQQAAVVYIRGIGSPSASIGDESSVATYVDGVYMFSPDSFFTELNNIERIEVLKGPQGTLYGRNATGGLINIITRDPSADPMLRGSVGYGNYDTVEAKAYASTKIVENLNADLAVVYRNQGKGYGYNVVRNTDYLKLDDIAVKSKVVIDPGEGTKLTLSGDYSKLHSDLGVSRRPEAGSVLANGTVYQGFFISPNNFKSDSHVESYGGSMRFEHDFGLAHLLSISAIRRGHTLMNIDQDGSPATNFTIQSDGRIQQLTQEVQLLSSEESRLKWIVGAFYMDASAAYTPLLQSGAQFAVFGGSRAVFSDIGIKSKSAFAQMSYDILPRTNLTLGGRYTIDTRSISGVINSANGTRLSGANQSKTFKRPTWRLALDHKLSGNILIYASYDRGFKAGAYSGTDPTAPVVKPEILDAFQAGIKSDLFDHHLRLNISGFHYNDRNIQLQANRGTVILLSNAAKANISGFEVEATAKPIDGVTLNVGVSNVHGRYKSYPNAPGTLPRVNAQGVPTGGNISIIIPDASGNETIRTPPWQFNASINYVLPTSVGDFSAEVSFFHSDSFYWEADNRVKQKAYDVLNGSLGWKMPRADWGVRLWCKNLTNERYETFVSTSPTGDQGSPAAPRTYGATVEFNF